MEQPGWYPCPYLNREVELTEERLEHIELSHAEFLEAPHSLIPEVLASPEEILAKKPGSEELLFVRWYPDLLGGKFAVVVLVTGSPQIRPWIVTAYLARRLAGVRVWPIS